MKQCHCGQFWKSCQFCLNRKNSDELKTKAENKRIKRAKAKMEKQLTDKEKLEGAFEIMCSGILYEPEGCKMKLGTYKNGCGMCGKGNSKKCDFYLIEGILMKDEWKNDAKWPEPPDEKEVPTIESENQWNAYRNALTEFSKLKRA